MAIEHSGATNGRLEEPDLKDESLEVEEDEEARIIISLSWCKGCGLCVEHCPTDVLILKEGTAKVAHLEDCIQCELCENICPDFSITIDDLGKK